MNYRHAYHAGNFADVVKHVCLARLQLTLQRKPAAYCYFETHAGAGQYALDEGPARKSCEWRDGVARAWGAPTAGLGDGVDAWLRTVNTLNDGGEAHQPHRYPGSPYLALALARAHDRLILCELHPEEATMLKRTLGRDRRVHVHQRDGYEALEALLPPPEKRGVVFVDPPYEDASDFTRLPEAVAAACKRWPNGIFALWYPLKDPAEVGGLKRRFIETGLRKVLMAELELAPPGSGRLYGSGLIVVNAPWQFERDLNVELGDLETLLAQGGSRRKVEWLVPE